MIHPTLLCGAGFSSAAAAIYASGCRVGSIGPVSAGWAGPESVRCAAPAHAPRAVVVSAVGAVHVTPNRPPTYAYLASGDDMRQGYPDSTPPLLVST